MNHNNLSNPLINTVQSCNLKLIRKPELLERFGFSKTTLHTKISKEQFPPPIALGDRAVAWPSHELDLILSAMVAGKSDDEMRALVADLVAQRKLSA
jgi:prophage regulatory protein